MSLRGDLKQLVRAKRKEGWEIEPTKGGHLRWTFIRTGEMFISPATPSDYRSILNVKADIKRRETPRASCYN